VNQIKCDLNENENFRNSGVEKKSNCVFQTRKQNKKENEKDNVSCQTKKKKRKATNV